MPGKNQKFVAREHRHTIRQDDKISATLRRDNDKARLAARLLDLSKGGAKMRTPATVSIGQWMTVHLQLQPLQMNFERQAQVCWAKPDESGAWLLGCRFEPHLEEPLLSKLADVGLIDRRRHDRTPVEFPLRVRWELLPEDEGRATVQNLSSRGVCLRCSAAPNPGQRILLDPRLEMLAAGGESDSSPVPATCQWCLEQGDHYLVGCALQSEYGSKTLWNAARRYDQLQKRARWKRWFWPWGNAHRKPSPRRAPPANSVA